MLLLYFIIIICLLLGIEKHGVGNWKTISEFMGTNKTTRNVEEHYWEGYMGVHGYCLPAQTLWKDQLHDTSSFCPEVKREEQPSLEGGVDQDDEPPAEDLYRVGVTPGYQRGEPVRRDEGFQHLATSKASNKDKQELQDKLARLPGSDLPGFTPLRGDFDNEYEVSINCSSSHSNNSSDNMVVTVVETIVLYYTYTSSLLL